MTKPENVFEQLTPPGEGGIAVFGLEGPAVRAALAAAVSSNRLATLVPGELAYGQLLAADGSMLDEVLVACLLPRGRCERFELNCHAGGAAAEAAARRLVELGLCAGELPPEPENSALERAFRAALHGLHTRRQTTALAAARSALEPELGHICKLFASPSGWEPARLALQQILEESARLEPLLSSHRAVLAGPANAGKSTLFNMLSGADRAITSPHPGTTRDTVEASVALRGLSLRLVDTAGLGAGLGQLAERSQQLSREAAGDAGLLLLVLDASATANVAVEAEAISRCAKLLGAADKSIVIRNKIDVDATRALPESIAGGAGETVNVSALTGEGLPELLDAIERALLPAKPAGGAAMWKGECLSNLHRAYACAKMACVENDASAAAAAALRLEELRGKPV
jgi:tRNA modification GTPase